MEEAAKKPFYQRRITYQVAEIVLGICVVGAGVAVGMSDQEKKYHPYAVLFVFSVLTAISKGINLRIEYLEKAEAEREKLNVRSRCENQARLMIEGILGYFWTRYFEKVKPSNRLDHRATLFKCVEYDGPNGKAKRLEIFAREVSHKGSTTMWEVDENNRDKCYGVAGRIWIDRGFGIFTAACDWSDDPESKELYAKSLWMTVEQAERLGVRSKVFAGSPIMVNRSAWGVLLLDSRVEGEIDDNKKKVDLVTRYAEILGRTLEGLQL